MLTEEGQEGGKPVYRVTPKRFHDEYIQIRRDDKNDNDYMISVRTGSTQRSTYLTDEEFEELFLAWAAIRWEKNNGESS